MSDTDVIWLALGFFAGMCFGVLMMALDQMWVIRKRRKYVQEALAQHRKGQAGG